jgi:hypothetical protein
MDEAAIKRAIASATRETIQLARQKDTPPHKLLALATEYAEQLIMPVVAAAVEETLEDGFRQGREGRPAVAK